MGAQESLISNGLFLCESELIELTGYKRLSDQIRWLQSGEWRFELSAIGRPVVLRSYLERRMGGGTERFDHSRSPNFAALRSGKGS